MHSLHIRTVLHIQVQVRTWQCNRVSCNCAVVAREGNDVIKLDMCHGTYGHTFPKLTIPNKSTFSQGTVVQKNSHGTRWVVSAVLQIGK